MSNAFNAIISKQQELTNENDLSNDDENIEVWREHILEALAHLILVVLGLPGVDSLCVADALGQRGGRPGRDDGAVEVAGEGGHLVRAVALGHQLGSLISDAKEILSFCLGD